MTKLIVGLGNPGREYHDTRHNIGMMLLDEYLGSSMWKSKFKSEYMTLNKYDEKFIFIKPLTFMNLSGEAVRKAVDFFKVEITDILVIHDELDFDYERLALKNAGGLAGHNGLKSITAHMNGQNFLRLRMGIGRPVHGDVSNYVLSKFSNEENISLDSFLNNGIKALEAYMEFGFEKAFKSFK